MNQLSLHRKKIALIGAGNIGGTLAHLCLQKRLGDVVLFDVKEGFPQGKALDLMQSAAVDDLDGFILGTNKYEDIANSDVIIVTAGLPRKPGMSRDDLLTVNSKIIKDVGGAIKKYAPNAFVICVTNPLDIMVWLLAKFSGVHPSMIVGMAGILDSARFRTFLSWHFNVSIKNVEGFVLGGHGDTMVPLSGLSRINGVSLADLVKNGQMTQADLDAIITRTRMGGGEIVNLLKEGSAYYAPACSALSMAESYLFDLRRILPCASFVQHDYDVPEPMFLGLPTLISAKGAEKIVKIPMTEQELTNLKVSINAVHDLIKAVRSLNLDQ